MKLHCLENRSRKGIVSFGGYWEKGEVTSQTFSLKNSEGKEINMQSKSVAFWPDGSTKWSIHTALAEEMSEEVELLPIEKEGQTQKGICIEKEKEYYRVNTGLLKMEIPFSGKILVENILKKESLVTDSIYPVFVLENIEGTGYNLCKKTQEFQGEVCSVEVEEEGPLQAVFVFRGNHIPFDSVESRERHMPFVIRMYLYANTDEIRFEHTFLYDGIEECDYLKGMGIRFEMPLSGAVYDRHLQIPMQDELFHECAMQLLQGHPRLTMEIYEKQMAGAFIEYEKDSLVEQAVESLPIWRHYSVLQDSSYHFAIRKRAREGVCKLTCKEGIRGKGVLAVNDRNHGFILGMRDFWQKYPSGMEVNNLHSEMVTCTSWFYSPEADSFDFRHYDTKSYQLGCYEGFPDVDASAYGIGVTSTCSIRFTDQLPTADDMQDYAEKIQKPPIYVGEASYYAEKKAFGYISTPSYENESEIWLENQLSSIIDFYKTEIEKRDWYGLFNYGDVMHTFDEVRKVWRYDIGGFAWQNTELVPTYWLWLYFLRTGREDVFTIAEAMSRHCSEVDLYHFGPNKGLGSRHNVRHWGCSCKEPRIAMAGHHRFLFYLTGDHRLRDIFEDVKDADLSWVSRQMKRRSKPGEKYVPDVRSGPDWSSFVSNWMTWYELTGEVKYWERINQGISDIWNSEYRLLGSPGFYYDVDKAALSHIPEKEYMPNKHLEICMGGPQVWWELGQSLEDERLNKMIEELGAFYYLSPEEKKQRIAGKMDVYNFGWQYMASGIVGYAAMKKQDAALAGKAWKTLLDVVKQDENALFKATNTASQWCLNVMMCLVFIKEYLQENASENVE